MSSVYWLVMRVKRWVCGEEVKVFECRQLKNLLGNPVYWLVVGFDSWVSGEEEGLVGC